MNSKKRAALAMLAAVPMLGLAACSGGGGQSGDSGSASGDVIRMSAWYEESLMEEPLAAVNAQLEGTGIQVEYTYVPHDQYDTWLSTQLASGSGPDIVVDGANFPARIKAGNLVPITDNEYLSKYNESGLTLSTAEDGQVYGIPAYGWFSGIFYNVDIFEEQKLEVPTTFDEFLAVSKKLQDADIDPLTLGLSDGDTAWHSLTGYLENAYYNNGTGSTEIDTEFAYGEATLAGNWNAAVTEWSKLIDQGIINDRMLGLSSDQALSEFGAGEAAMTISGPWNYDNLKASGVNFAMFSHVGNDADNQWLVGGPAANFGINVDSKNQENAAKVLEALASSETQTAFLEANSGSFSYYEGVEIEIPAEYDLVAPILAERKVGTPMDRWGVNMPAQSMVDTAIKELQTLILGQTDVDGFVDALDSHADSIRY